MLMILSSGALALSQHVKAMPHSHVAKLCHQTHLLLVFDASAPLLACKPSETPFAYTTNPGVFLGQGCVMVLTSWWSGTGRTSLMSPNRTGNLAVMAPPNSSTFFQSVSTSYVTVMGEAGVQSRCATLLRVCSPDRDSSTAATAACATAALDELGCERAIYSVITDLSVN